MSESRPSSDRDFVSAAAEMFRDHLEFTLDVSDGQGLADLAASLMEPEDDDDFVEGLFSDAEEPFADLGYFVAVVVEDGRLEAGRLRALYDALVGWAKLLLELAHSVKTEGGRNAP